MLWFLLFVPILIVIATFVVGISWYIAHTTMVPRRRSTTGDPGHLDLPYEEVTFGSDGSTLRGWFIPAKPEGRRPGIVLTHGWSSNAEQLLPVAAFLRDAGFHSLLFSVRGHGDSSPADFVSIVQYAADIRGAVDYLTSRDHVDTERIGLLGHSMGAAASLLEASKDDRVKAVVSSAGFADFGDLTAQLLKWRRLPIFPFRWLIQWFWRERTGLTVLEVNPVEIIRRVDCPVLLLHGDLDRVVPPNQLKKLQSRGSAASLQSVMVAGHNHNDIYRSDIFEQEVLRFFREELEQRRVAVDG
jgi:dipeptidyl aminopeptidase/acylaminoacyl peptidase